MTVTIPNPPGIDAAGKGAVYWVPALADPSAPTVAEIAAGVVLSCALDTWPTTVDQSTTSKSKYCDAQPRQRLGKPQYSAGPIVYDYDPQGVDTSGNYGYYDDLTPGLDGFFIDRRGIDSKAAVAAGQKVDVWPARLGARVRVDIDPTNTDGESLRTQQSVSVTGEVLFDVEIVAA